MDFFSLKVGYSTNSMTFLSFIPVYGLLAVLGFCLSFAWGYIEWNKKGNRTWDFIYISIFSTIFGLYGAKIWYLIFDFNNSFGKNGIDDLQSLLYAIFIPSSGRTIIGTIIFAILGIYLYPKFFSPDIDWLKSADILMPAILLAQALGRWGNFANHTIYGLETSEASISWLPEFIKNNMLIDGKYRQPLFLYESIIDLFTFTFIFIVFKTNNFWKKGTSMSAYIMMYGISRASFELFRDKQFIMNIYGWPTSFIVSIVLSIIGFVFLVSFQLKFTRNDFINSWVKNYIDY